MITRSSARTSRVRALDQDPAGLQHGDPVGERADDVHVVLDQHDGAARRATRGSARPCGRRPRAPMPAVGSSSSSTFGSRARARASSRARFRPYGRVPAGASATVGQPDLVQQLHAPAGGSRRSSRPTARTASPARSALAAPARRARRAVSWSNRLVIWNERATPRRAICSGGSPVTSRPASSIRPAVGAQEAGEQVEQRGLAGAVRARPARARCPPRRRGRPRRRRGSRGSPWSAPGCAGARSRAPCPAARVPSACCSARAASTVVGDGQGIEQRQTLGGGPGVRRCCDPTQR